MSFEHITFFASLLLFAFAGVLYFLQRKNKSNSDALVFEIYENIDCGIIMLDTNNRIINANSKAQATFSQSGNNLLKANIFDLVGSNQNVDVFEHLTFALSSQELAKRNAYTFQGELLGNLTDKHTVSVRVVPYFKKERLQNVVILIKDITEIEKYRIKNIQLEERLLNQDDKHPLVNFVASVSPNIEVELISISNKIVSLLGKNYADVLDNPKLLLPDDETEAQRLKDIVRESCHNLTPFDFTSKYLHVNGSEKILNVRALPYHEDNQLFIRGFINDITETFTQNQIIKEQRLFLSSIIENSPIGIFAKSQPEGKYLVVNGKAIDFFGKTQGEMLHKTDKELFENADLFYNHLADLENECIKSLQICTGRTFEYSTYIGIKQIYLESVPVVVDGVLKQTIGIIHDLTENVNVINAYKERQNKLTAIVDNNLVGVIVIDKMHNIIYANKAFSRMSGFSISELHSLNIKDITHSESIRDNINNLKQIWNGEVHSAQFEKKYLRKDGSSFDAEVFVSPVLDNMDRISSTVGLVINIDKRKDAEKMLLQRDKILEAVSFASRHYLNADDFDRESTFIFDAIAESTNADYIAIYEIDSTDGFLRGEQRRAMFKDEYKQLEEEYKTILLSRNNNEIVNSLEMGRYIYLTESLSSPLNTLLIETREKTVFICPIMVDETLWGVIKIGKIDEEHFWSHGELDALQSAANVMGAAINRRRINMKIKELNTDLESRIAQRTELLESEIKERKTIESNLLISQQKLRKMVDIAPIGIAKISNKNVIEEANPQMLQIFEYAKGELEGTSFLKLYPEKQKPIYERLHQNFINSGTDHSGERPFVSRSGKPITAYINLLKTENERGLIDIYVFIYDITEQKRVESNAKKLKLGIEKSYDAFCITNLFGEVEYANNAFEMITGYTIEEITGKNLRVLKSGLQTPEFYKAMWEDVLMGKNWQGTLVNKRKNGDFYYEEMTIVPVFNELNIITNYVAIKRDVTAVKKSQEEILKSETKYRQIFENATEGIIMLNYETILFANPAFEQLTGYSNFQVNNRKFIDMIFDADKETVFKLTHTKDKNFLHQKHDVRLVDTNNNIKWVNINANKVNWDNKIMILLFISNITGRKKAEEALEEERTFLAERVIERTEELSALNAELSKAVRAKDEFLANMSHELRTPLNAILGLSEILQYQLQGNINEKQQKSFKTINESGQHLLSLINDILDLSKIEAGKLDLLKENVLIDPICVSSLRFISETANKKSIKVHYDHSDKNLQVWADTRRLRQILINLLSNAVKFTPAGKEIGLTVTPSQDKHTILFEVWDNGIGIPERDMKSLFKPFVQLDSALSREFEGSGLGLSLVAKMVELHGGSIEVQSQLGEGSRFIVAMPSKNPDIIEYEEDLDYDISCMQDRTVIVITESQSDYNVISNVLHERTAHIYRFDDDSKGINDVMEIQPHLIIIDSTIKHRSAWEIMAILKNDFRTKDIKIIMASMGKELEKASVVGADAFIGKPITANKVRKALCETYGVQFMDAFQNDKDKQFTILLAEDNEANIETIEAFLTMNKYKIIVARNGQEAIEWVHEHRPDLILMDIQMPKMNGFEAIEFLKTSDEFRDIPIIALTALAMPGDRKKILDAGANDYLSKPISMIVLIERIQSYLKSR